jgi:hypothetical protein
VEEGPVIDIPNSFINHFNERLVDSKPSWRVVSDEQRSLSMTSHIVLWAIILCASVCLTSALGHAQQLTTEDFAPAARATTGWWSPDRTGSTLVTPRLQVNMSELARFAAPERPPSSLTEPINYSIADQPAFELKPATQSVEISALTERELLSPQSLLSLVDAKYLAWESSLSDTRSLTSVDGILVYPLVQIDYPQWRLPISLYIPPLRGSDAR